MTKTGDRRNYRHQHCLQPAYMLLLRSLRVRSGATSYAHDAPDGAFPSRYWCRLPILVTLLLACFISFPATTLLAQSTLFSQQVEADTFVSSGEPDSNFGNQGGLEIATPTLGQPRTQKSLLRFSTADMRAAFDADYGPGNWTVTDVTLSLFSSYATAGQQPNNGRFNQIAAGGFEFDLLSNDNWSETGITWNTLSDILPGPGNINTLTPLGTFFWDAAGEPSSIWTLDPNSDLASQIYNGDSITIFGQPTANSTVGYLFNSGKVTPAFLNVTATVVPEPSIHAFVGLLLVACCWFSPKKTPNSQREPCSSE